MIIKLISLKSNISGWEGFNKGNHSNLTMGKSYEIIYFTETNLEGMKWLGYHIIDDDGELNVIPEDCIELIDESIPEFWEKKHYYDACYYYAPNGWVPELFYDHQDGMLSAIERVYIDYQKYYKKKIKVQEISRTIPKGLDIICKKKNGYLLPTEEDLYFDFITETDPRFDIKEFGLTIGQKYKVFEVKNKESFWFKVKNDFNNEQFYPRTIFKEIRNKIWYNFFYLQLSDDEINKLLNGKDSSNSEGGWL